jgi:hypothetical protein
MIWSQHCPFLEAVGGSLLFPQKKGPRRRSEQTTTPGKHFLLNLDALSGVVAVIDVVVHVAVACVVVVVVAVVYVAVADVAAAAAAVVVAAVVVTAADVVVAVIVCVVVVVAADVVAVVAVVCAMVVVAAAAVVVAVAHVVCIVVVVVAHAVCIVVAVAHVVCVVVVVIAVAAAVCKALGGWVESCWIDVNVAAIPVCIESYWSGVMSVDVVRVHIGVCSLHRCMLKSRRCSSRWKWRQSIQRSTHASVVAARITRVGRSTSRHGWKNIKLGCFAVHMKVRIRPFGGSAGRKGRRFLKTRQHKIGSLTKDARKKLIGRLECLYWRRLLFRQKLELTSLLSGTTRSSSSTSSRPMASPPVLGAIVRTAL